MDHYTHLPTPEGWIAINLIWLPTHIDIKGNEPADRLANLAISGDNIDIDIGLDLSEA